MLRSAIRILVVLNALLLSALVDRQNQGTQLIPDTSKPLETAVMTPQRPSHQEATLSDASQLYRICSSRPQRIVSSHGSNSERTFNPCTLLVRRHFVKPLHSLYDSRCRLETAPFCVSASRSYYVIALRHIIR